MVLAAFAGLLMPRVVMVVMWLFSDYLRDAYGTWLWPFLGFFFLPTTTLCFAIAEQELRGFTGWGAALTILGVLVDAGLVGQGRGLLKGTLSRSRA